MIKRFQRSIQVIFSFIDPDLGYWKVNTTGIELNLLDFSMPLGLRFHVKPAFFFKKILVVICALMIWL